MSRHHLGDALGARKALEQSLELAPADVDLLVSLGDLCLGEKDFPQAYDYFTRALENAPTDIDAVIGQIYAGNGLKQESLTQRALQRLSELEPSHPLLADVEQ
ncbi:Tetratricopeptide repeat protein [compost metagenome]